MYKFKNVVKSSTGNMSGFVRFLKYEYVGTSPYIVLAFSLDLAIQHILFESQPFF